MQLISTGFDQNIKMMDLQYLLYKDKAIAEDKITIDGHDKWIHGGMYSSDGKYYITIGEDRKIKTWYTNTDDLAKAVQAILTKQK